MLMFARRVLQVLSIYLMVYFFSLESQKSEACELSQLWLPLLDFARWVAFTSIYNYQIFFNFCVKPVKW